MLCCWIFPDGKEHSAGAFAVSLEAAPEITGVRAPA